MAQDLCLEHPIDDKDSLLFIARQSGNRDHIFSYALDQAETDRCKKRRETTLELGFDHIIAQKWQCVIKSQMLLLDRAPIPAEALKAAKTVTDYIESVELYLYNIEFE
jgi:hypothetical protein